MIAFHFNCGLVPRAFDFTDSFPLNGAIKCTVTDSSLSMASPKKKKEEKGETMQPNDKNEIGNEHQSVSVYSINASGFVYFIFFFSLDIFIFISRFFLISFGGGCGVCAFCVFLFVLFMIFREMEIDANLPSK